MGDTKLPCNIELATIEFPRVRVSQISGYATLVLCQAQVLGVVESETLLQVVAGKDYLAQVEQGHPQGIVGLHEPNRVLHAPGQGQTLLHEPSCRP